MLTVLVIMLCVIYLFYMFATSRYKRIQVIEKYIHKFGNLTNYIIVDNNGNHYWVGSVYSIMLGWITIDIFSGFNYNFWLQIKEIDYDIKYYGFRIPVLGIFPIVVSLNH